MNFCKFLLSFIFIFLFSCGVSSPEEVDDYEIEQILEEIEKEFNFGNLEGIMIYYHEDFLHNNKNYWEEETVWQLRLLEYNMIEFQNIEVEINGAFAQASFKMIFTNNSGVHVFNEPEDHGDVSYFYKENQVWKIYGNQFE